MAISPAAGHVLVTFGSLCTAHATLVVAAGRARRLDVTMISMSSCL
jgi:hypothetical protein